MTTTTKTRRHVANALIVACIAAALVAAAVFIFFGWVRPDNRNAECDQAWEQFDEGFASGDTMDERIGNTMDTPAVAFEDWCLERRDAQQAQLEEDLLDG